MQMVQSNINYSRICPTCNVSIYYTSYSGYWHGNRYTTSCRRCVSIKTGFLQRYATKKHNTGKNNAFYGKHHTQKTKKKLRQSRLGKKMSNEFKKKMSTVTSGKNNGMYNKNVYAIWLNKYGKTIADKKESIRRNKLSKRMSGKKNPMYGKPSPMKSGNGWKGWYKGTFFRSLRELCYMIFLDKNKIHWETAETKKFNIRYKFNKSDRTYKPDFIINKNTIIEIKPKKLHNTKIVKIKARYAKKFCKINKLKYKIIDVKINADDIIKNKKYIKWVDKYKQKFQSFILEGK